MTWTPFRRAAATAGIGTVILAIIGFGAVSTGILPLRSQPASMAQPCVGGSNLVPSLFGDDATTQIRLSTPDLKTQRVLRTEPASRLPAMFQSLLSVSRDGNRLAYVTADDEQLDNARITYIDIAHPQSPHVIATETSGMLPIRPVWSPTAEQLAFVVARHEQAGISYRVLAASAAGGPVLDIANLPQDAFDSLETNVLCVTSAGSVNILPPPAPRNGDVAAAPAMTLVTPYPAGGVGGGTRCALPVLSQNDPRWKDHQMQPTGETLGQVGCAVTSTAMVLDYYASNLTPAQLSDCLGPSAVPIYWSNAVACTQGHVSGSVATDFSWTALDATLAAGRPAIVGMLGSQVGMHFVVVTSGGGDIADRYRIVDPWHGRSDGTLGGYTRSNWTLFQLVDFRGIGPGCGKLLIPGPDLLKVVDGISDGAWYHGAVTLRRLVDGVQVTVKKLSHDANKPDQKWDLGSVLTLTEDGNYHVIISSSSGGAPTVLSFTIDNTPPTVGVKFFNQISTLKAPGGSSEPVIAFPGRFEVYASDPLTGVVSIKAQLDNQPIVVRHSVAGVENRTLFDVVTTIGTHHLSYSATNAAGLSAAGQATFVVQNSPGSGIPGPPGSVVSPSPSAPTITFVPLPPNLFCINLTSVTLTDQVSTSTITGAATHTLRWSGSGTCGPFSGTITATYGSFVSCQFPCVSHWVFSTKTYQISGVSGTYQDLVGSGVSSTSYKVTLTDGRNNTATASAT